MDITNPFDWFILLAVFGIGIIVGRILMAFQIASIKKKIKK